MKDGMKILSRSKKLLLGIILFFVIFTIAGFFVVPPILRSILTKTLSESLKREVLIREVKFNPYTLSATVKGITVKEREEISKEHPFFAVDEFFVNLESFSLLRMAIVIMEIRIRKPQIWITRRSDLTFNFSDLLSAKEEMKSGLERKGLRMVVSIS